MRSCVFLSCFLPVATFITCLFILPPFTSTMSDDDDMMYDEDYDDVDEDAGDAEDVESEGVEIENQYYNSKGRGVECGNDHFAHQHT